MAEIISIILIVAVMGIVIGLITTEKMNRAVAALSGAIITIFIMYFIEGKQFISIVGYFIGASEDPAHPNYLSGDWGNLHAILLILGMMIIIQVAQSSGLFQYIAFNLLKMTGRSSIRLFLTITMLGIVLSAVLNSVMAIMILIPLVAMIGRILNIDAKPYIITLAITVRLGSPFFTISSVENVLIAASENLDFLEFFLIVGIPSFLLIFPTGLFFYFFFRKKLQNPRSGIEILKEFDTWSFIPNKRLFYKAMIVFLVVLVCFFVIPSEIVPPDIIALTGGVIMLVICRVNVNDIIAKLDFQLLFLLAGIFIMTGALEDVGLLEVISNGFNAMSGGNILAITLIMLWIPGYITGFSDALAITKIMLPVVDQLTASLIMERRFVFNSLCYAVNLGDNLTAMGDNVVALNVADQVKNSIKVKELTVPGFIVVNLQFFILTIYFCFIIEPWNNWVIGVTLIVIVAGIIGVTLLVRYFIHKKLHVRVRDMLKLAKNPDFKFSRKPGKPETDIDESEE